jgi:hypothetical protein
MRFKSSRRRGRSELAVAAPNTMVHFTMMATPAADPRPAADGAYRELLANFHQAYRRVQAASEAFNRVLVEVGPVSDPESKLCIPRVSTEYQEANQEFLVAAAKLNQFIVSEAIATRPIIQKRDARP